jgi:hypothetical protein
MISFIKSLEGCLVRSQLLTISYFISQCKEGGNIQKDVQLPLEFIPLTLFLLGLQPPSECFQFYEGMFLEEDIVIG